MRPFFRHYVILRTSKRPAICVQRLTFLRERPLDIYTFKNLFRRMQIQIETKYGNFEKRKINDKILLRIFMLYIMIKYTKEFII